MKPISIEETHKRRGWVPFSTFAFVDEPPKRISFTEHLIRYKGQDENLDIPWGVYGSTSYNLLSYYASHYASSKKKAMIVLTMWYYIEGFGEATVKLPRTLKDTHGFVHTGRLGKDLREEIHADLLKIIKRDRPSAQISRYSELSWGELLMREPAVVRRYLQEQKGALVVVHPVRQMYDAHSEEMIQVGSFKLKRDLIMAVEARNFNDIVAEI